MHGVEKAELCAVNVYRNADYSWSEDEKTTELINFHSGNGGILPEKRVHDGTGSDNFDLCVIKDFVKSSSIVVCVAMADDDGTN